LDPLNKILRRDERFGEIVARDRIGPSEIGTGFVCESRARWSSTESLLVPIAKAIAELICTDDFRFIRLCEGGSCNLMFVDRTRGRARRWCSMATCGNRAKAQAHRDRHRMRCEANGQV
jgi:predicted RNA-binding Zn ribbon-like protein